MHLMNSEQTCQGMVSQATNWLRFERVFYSSALNPSLICENQGTYLLSVNQAGNKRLYPIPLSAAQITIIGTMDIIPFITGIRVVASVRLLGGLHYFVPLHTLHCSLFYCTAVLKCNSLAGITLFLMHHFLILKSGYIQYCCTFYSIVLALVCLHNPPSARKAFYK